MMAFDRELEERIQAVVNQWENVSAKKMFGGVCHLIAGNMFCGVYKKDLILRLGATQAAEALGRAHVKPFDITGKAMKGWVMVAPQGVDTRKALLGWLQKARDFALTLPAK